MGFTPFCGKGQHRLNVGWFAGLSFSSIGTTAHCGLWPVEQYSSIFSYLPPTLSIFSLPALENLFLLPLSIFSCIFPFFSTLQVLCLRNFRIYRSRYTYCVFCILQTIIYTTWKVQWGVHLSRSGNKHK